MTELSPTDMQFFLTAETACPYLPAKHEQKLFTHLSGKNAGALHELLSYHGFRRSQNIVYRPACEGCQACQSARTLVDNFKQDARQRRIWRKNADVTSEIVPAVATKEQYDLFKRYLGARHKDGGMADMSQIDFEYMVEDTPVETNITEYRNQSDDLLGVVLTDILPDGVSMVYSFFDPSAGQRSLGRYMVLEQIERTRQLNLPFLYLGYWVKDSPKMAYKSSFGPLEALDHGDHWQLLDEK